MKVGSHVIPTPTDDPLGYALDWRWQLAQAAVEATDGRVYLHDADARALAQHVQRRQKWPLKDGEKPNRFDRVVGWRDSQASALLDAFLLAADTYPTVGAELGLPANEVALYARLFLDVRDEQGRTRPAILMRLQADLQDQEDAPAAMLRRIALTGGIHGLRRVLHAAATAPTAEPGLDQLVEAELTRRLHAGELRTGDLVRLQANAIARQRIELDKKHDQPQWQQGMELVRYVLGLTAPDIVQADRSQDSIAASTQAIRGRFAAQRNIGATPLTDEPDKGYQALTELMGKHFKPGES